VIAPRQLDEAGKRVKTDARDAGVLCQRLSRYVEGNRKELAVIRVPTEEEEQLRHIHRQREALVRARTKLQAQGRGLLVTDPKEPRRARARRPRHRCGAQESHPSTSLRTAVARQLAVDLWRWQTGQCSPQQLGLEPPTTMTHTTHEP
jgi:transposase